MATVPREKRADQDTFRGNALSGAASNSRKALASARGRRSADAQLPDPMLVEVADEVASLGHVEGEGGVDDWI